MLENAPAFFFLCCLPSICELLTRQTNCHTAKCHAHHLRIIHNNTLAIAHEHHTR